MQNRIDSYNDICSIKYEWMLNNMRHCSTGPAIEYQDGVHEWWLNGSKVSENEFKRLTKTNS
jgi:hypothetical protein